MEISYVSIENLETSLVFLAEAKVYLRDIRKNFYSDFAPPSSQYYTEETYQNLFDQAVEKLNSKLSQQDSPINFSMLREAWNQVVIDFYQNQRWGALAVREKPKVALSEDQKIFRELAPYFGLIFVVAFTVKTAFFYYGMHSASNPSTENNVWLGITLALFFSSMFFFAWKKHK
jgi:hypothetical protein